MNSYVVVAGVATASLLASSCASTARDRLLEIYNDPVSASSFDETCRVEDRTFATAAEAYLAATDAAPTSASDLVPEWIREQSDAWQFDAGSPTSFSPVAGGRCDGVDLEHGTSSTVGQHAVDRIEDADSANCARDKRQIETGLELHFTVNGEDAETLGELVRIGIQIEDGRWTLEPSPDPTVDTPLVVPVPGGPCDG